MNVDKTVTTSKKRSRDDALADNDDGVAPPPAKKQKIDHLTAPPTNVAIKEKTPPLDIEDDDIKKSSSNSDKPALAPAPSTGTMAIKKRKKQPGLAKCPSNLLAFNGYIAEKNDKKDDHKMELDKDKDKDDDDAAKKDAKNKKKNKKSSDKEEADVDNDNDDDIKKDDSVININRQKLLSELKECLAPCSRELISKKSIACCLWFDQDDDGNSCIWIAKIESYVLDESRDATSMLCTYPGFDDNLYWVPVIYNSTWNVYQPNDILLQDKYSNLFHKNNYISGKDLLTKTKENLSDISDSDFDFDDNDDDISIKKKKKKKVIKKRKKPKKKRKITAKRKKATSTSSAWSWGASSSTAAAASSSWGTGTGSAWSWGSSKITTTKYASSNKRIQSLDDVDTTKMSFTPVSKKHLVQPALKTNKDLDPQLIEILFSFDTTGSMSSCLESVRTNLKNILNLMFKDIPSLRVGIIAHGDYCDENIYYVMRWVDFVDENEKDKLIKFVDEVTSTGGGDAPECYELVLHNASRQFSWSPNCENRSLVMIGDENPHAVSGNNPYKLDWKEKLSDCIASGIKIYGIHCLSNISSAPFYQKISDDSRGVMMELNKIKSFAGMMVALCHREHDLLKYDETKESEIFLFEKKKADILVKKYESYTVDGLKEMLKYNGQKVGGTKYELIDRIIDCNLYGIMPKCGKCGGGHLRVIYINGKKYGHAGQGRYFCPGYYNGNEYVACLWSGNQTKIKRDKWIDMDAQDINDNDDKDDDINNNNNNNNNNNK